jgi:hypothetical protein
MTSRKWTPFRLSAKICSDRSAGSASRRTAKKLEPKRNYFSNTSVKAIWGISLRSPGLKVASQEMKTIPKTFSFGLRRFRMFDLPRAIIWTRLNHCGGLMSRTEQRAGFGNRYLVIDSFISTRDKRLELLRDRMTHYLNHQMSPIRRCIARNSGLRFVGNVQHCQHLVEECTLTFFLLLSSYFLW